MSLYVAARCEMYNKKSLIWNIYHYKLSRWAHWSTYVYVKSYNYVLQIRKKLDISMYNIENQWIVDTLRAYVPITQPVGASTFITNSP